MHRLLILDEQPLVRWAIEALLDDVGVVAEIEGVDSPAAAIARLRAGDWSAMVMELSLSDGGGTAVLSRLSREHPALPILVFTALPEAPYGLRALRAGASGFLRKTAPPAVLVEALQGTLAGRRSVSPALAEQLADHWAEDVDDSVHGQLSERELEVFRLIALGKSMSEIGDRLKISPKTAHAHRANILRKTGLADNQALTSYAFERKLIPGRRAEDRGLPWV